MTIELSTLLNLLGFIVGAVTVVLSIKSTTAVLNETIKNLRDTIDRLENTIANLEIRYTNHEIEINKIKNHVGIH